MSRVVIALVLIAVVVVVALVLQRRRPQPPTQSRWAVPSQLDRNDFDRPDAPYLVAVFTSATCASCEGARAKASVLASRNVAFQELSYQTRKDLHERYAVETVPMILVADADGVVTASFIGTPPAAELWASVGDTSNR
jgi:thioredoxin-related protein